MENEHNATVPLDDISHFFDDKRDALKQELQISVEYDRYLSRTLSLRSTCGWKPVLSTMSFEGNFMYSPEDRRSYVHFLSKIYTNRLHELLDAGLYLNNQSLQTTVMDNDIDVQIILRGDMEYIPYKLRHRLSQRANALMEKITHGKKHMPFSPITTLQRDYLRTISTTVMEMYALDPDDRIGEIFRDWELKYL